MTAPRVRHLKSGKLPGVLRRRMLNALLDRPGQVVTPETLAPKIWPDGAPPKWRICLAQQARYINVALGADVIVRHGTGRRLEGFSLQGGKLPTGANLIRGDRPKRPRRYDWTEAEDRVLRQNAGAMTLSELTAAVNAVHGRERRPSGVEGHLYVLGLSKRIDAFSQRSASQLFGVEHEVVGAWLAAGLLTGSRTERDRRSRRVEDAIRPSWWRISHEQVEQFIRAHPWEYDWRAMQAGHPLTVLARAVQARSPWLSLKQARKELGIGEATVLRWLKAGWFPSARRMTSRYSEDRSCWRISMADLHALRPERAIAV